VPEKAFKAGAGQEGRRRKDLKRSQFKWAQMNTLIIITVSFGGRPDALLRRESSLLLPALSISAGRKGNRRMVYSLPGLWGPKLGGDHCKDRGLEAVPQQ
jgi:hypothetical protein